MKPLNLAQPKIRGTSRLPAGRGPLLLLVAAAWAMLAVGPARAEGNVAAKSAAEVQIVPDLPYYEGPDADPVKHKLDLYLPRGPKDFPVLFFVHGGGWRHGDKNFFGVYSAVALACARHGIGAVVTNYRLSPAVVHPEHIKDVARAFAWVHRNIRKYGGRPDQLFISGHSAGGHLVALLATDAAYLKEVGLPLLAIKGAIPISGVYAIPVGDRYFDASFSTDARVRKEASPREHVRPGLPPALIIYAENDLPLCGKGPSEEFGRCLQGKHCDVRTLEIKERNHFTILLDAVTEGGPVAQAVWEFIEAHK